MIIAGNCGKVYQGKPMGDIRATLIVGDLRDPGNARTVIRKLNQRKAPRGCK